MREKEREEGVMRVEMRVMVILSTLLTTSHSRKSPSYRMVGETLGQGLKIRVNGQRSNSDSPVFFPQMLPIRMCIERLPFLW